MSGIGGQPSGWSDPYGRPGTPPAGWSDPAAPSSWDPYGQYTAPQQYGLPGVPGAQRGNGLAIAALICNVLLVTTCCNVLAIPGIITSSLAISRGNSDPESARTLTVWSWVLCVLALVIAIAVIIIALVVDASSSSSSGPEV
ncbi:hypothetical protein Arub01_21310 [Actinomadura rubrobrunea]|uniref:DUF4190 domain-containing protein n=1 Tax=Actinomadura rubrobrunea TaxID=115335 RepID=A0A9W6UW40_9ACTN|nr:hypothetical protein [Actinomadura rubrobrunea]GLW63887.1 hypothetical protein Arub01_21310 [Actinomadura rubrobrunea]